MKLFGSGSKWSHAGMFAVGAVTVLALGGTAAYAANGGSLLIGRSNGGTAPTTLTNPTGTALRLNSKAGTPSLSVNTNTKVPNLDADYLDGLSSEKFALAGVHTGIIVGSVSDADGFVDTAQCPSGTHATGGGGIAAIAGQTIAYSGPDLEPDGTVIPDSWFTVATDTGGNSGGAVAWVVCYNPRGNVPGAVSNLFTALNSASSRGLSSVRAAQKALPGLFRR
jgi:hypothetical protein